MAKDFLNVIERALLMGISDKINTLTEDGQDIYEAGVGNCRRVDVCIDYCVGSPD